MEDKIIESIGYLLPAAVTGYIAYYMFNRFVSKTDGNTRANVLAKKNKVVLTVKLQAYERLTLLLERIAPSNLLIRVKPYSDDKDEYERLLLKTIEDEFEHNLTQQVYVTEACWNVIRTAKSATVSIIRKTSMNEKVTTSDKLRETILRELMDNQTPSDAGLSYIKKEVAEII